MNHKGISPVCSLIQAFNSTFVTNEIIVCLPGYMSTTKQTIQYYCTHLNLNKSHRVTFLEGVNGRRAVNGVTNNIQQEHNSYFNGVLNNLSNGKDHSKMIFYLETEHDVVSVENCTIKALLIGSSNQSYETYFGSSKKRNKGESDIFIVRDDVFGEGVEEKLIELYDNLPTEIKENIILAKELKGNNDLLNEIWERSFI